MRFFDSDQVRDTVMELEQLQEEVGLQELRRNLYGFPHHMIHQQQQQQYGHQHHMPPPK